MPDPPIHQASSEDDEGLSTDAPGGPSTPGGSSADSGLSNKLQQLLVSERAAHAETMSDLQVERAAHDDTAEKLVELQQRLEVTLQELSNLERYVKRQEPVANPGTHPHGVERLLKEEAYLKSRLVFVQQELVSARAAAADGGAPGSAPRARREEAAGSAQTAEERVLDSALSI